MKEIKINKIEFTDDVEHMFDLEVPEFHNFILDDNIITHNSGKSFVSEVIIPMFTTNHAKVKGGSVSESRFYGGQSNFKSKMKNTPFSPGLIETKEVVTMDEMAEVMDGYAEGRNKQSNPMSWIKDANENIDRGIQGSRATRANAVLIMFGNIEGLTAVTGRLKGHIMRNFKQNMRSKCNDTEASHYFNNDWSLHQPPEYYKSLTSDNDINNAMCYAVSKTRIDNYRTFNYITGLPEAEQARLVLMLVREDGNVKYEMGKEPEKINKSSFIHSDQYIAELKTRVYKDKLKYDDEGQPIFPSSMRFEDIPKRFRADVWAWMVNYIMHQKNNYRFTDKVHLSTHFTQNLHRILTENLYLNKLWYGKEVKFDDEDAKILEFINRYNCNILNSEEAKMKTNTKVNMNCSYIDINEEENTTLDLDINKSIEESKDAELSIDMFDDVEGFK